MDFDKFKENIKKNLDRIITEHHALMKIYKAIDSKQNINELDEYFNAEINDFQFSRFMNQYFEGSPKKWLFDFYEFDYKEKAHV